MTPLVPLIVLSALAAAPVQLPRPEWSMFGGSPSRNMVSPSAKGLPDTFDLEKGSNILWKAELGTRSYTQPVVAGGKVFVGTNNERPRNPRDTRKDSDGEVEPIDKNILMCFDAGTGKFLWQAVHDRRHVGPIQDWPRQGQVSTPAVEGDRLYYVTPAGVVVCADANGLADGNQGIQNEKYRDPSDVDILWQFNMPIELDVSHHCLSASSPLIVGDLLFLVTGNGVNEGHLAINNPNAPSFLALNKHTGKVVWHENSPGKNILHGQWSSPAYAAEPVPHVIFPGDDGWLRAFEPKTGKLLWKFDANPSRSGNRNDFLAMPVVHEGRLYIGTGQDPEHFSGIAYFHCLDLKRAIEHGQTNPGRDVSPEQKNTASVWRYGGEEVRQFRQRDVTFGRTMSTACVVEDRIYAAELQGQLHCLDRRTGKVLWMYDCKGAIWASPYYADGKVYMATEAGELFVFKHAPNAQVLDPNDIIGAINQKAFNVMFKSRMRDVEKEYLLAKIELDAPLRATPTAMSGVLYLTTEKTLYAIGKK